MAPGITYDIFNKGLITGFGAAASLAGLLILADYKAVSGVLVVCLALFMMASKDNIKI